ncbi:MAG: 5'-methylthioadenosine/adenosylhomocysteine nucleosidase [Cyanobacteria bacterium P01_E01_bin.34]
MFEVNNVEPIGIIGAMPEEIEQLRSRMSNVAAETILQRQFYTGQLANKTVVLVKSGIGKTRSAITATTLVTHYGVRGLIFTGVAGALRPGLRTGDAVLAHEAREHDFGTAKPDGFELGLPFLPGQDYKPIVARPDLYDLALQLACQEPGIELVSKTAYSSKPSHKLESSLKPQIFAGVVATGDVFVADPSLSERIHQLTGADVVEMEGTSVVRVAEDAGIPCVLVRTVSDSADREEFLDFFSAVAANSAAIAEAILMAL